MARDPKEEFYSSYVYCQNNPLAYLDPNGEWTAEAGFAIGKFKLGYNEGELTVGVGIGPAEGFFGSFDPNESSGNNYHLSAKLTGSANFSEGNGPRDVSGTANAGWELVDNDDGLCYNAVVEGNISTAYGGLSVKGGYKVENNFTKGRSQLLPIDPEVTIKAQGGAHAFAGVEVEG